MNVFLSWSGTQSKKLAEVFRDWLGTVLPGVRPWLSSEDIGVGAQWFPALIGQLESTSACILFLTPQNVRSPWLYFEAGAIAAKRNDAKVCSYLIGVSGPQLAGGPLGQFQWAESTREGTWKLLRELNRGFPAAHEESLLEAGFTQKWPALKRKLDTLLTEEENGPPRGLETQPSPAVYELTNEARTLLREATEDRTGMVLMLRTSEGLIVQTNGKQFAERGNARSEAVWQAAVRQLLQFGLLESRGAKGEVFGLSAEGFRVGDGLRHGAAAALETAE